MKLTELWTEFIEAVVSDETLDLAEYYDEETDCTFVTALRVIDRGIKSRTNKIMVDE